MTAHALTLWSQEGTSTAATWDTCVDRLKLPILQKHCSDLAADDSTPRLDNALSSSPPTEFCDRPSSQQQEPATTSHSGEPYATRSGRTIRCPERLDLQSHKLRLIMYEIAYRALQFFFRTPSSPLLVWISGYYYRLEGIGHWLLSSALLILEHYFIVLVGFTSFLSYEKRDAMYVADTGQRYTRVSHAHNTELWNKQHGFSPSYPGSSFPLTSGRKRLYKRLETRVWISSKFTTSVLIW